MVMISHFKVSTMRKPKEIRRTTLDKCFDGETLLPRSGIYVLAYIGRVVYVGKANDITDRMRVHVTVGEHAIDYWLRGMFFDFPNIRLDILETPADVDYVTWHKEAEASLVQYFSPLFNNLLQ